MNSALPPALVSGEIGLVRSLGEAGIPVYLSSYYDDNIAFYSKYCRKRIKFSHSTSRDFVDRLVGLGRNEQGKMVFFSDDDRAVLTFSRYRDELEPYYYFNLPDHETVETLLDKRKFAVRARQLSLPVPCTVLPESADDVRCAMDEIGFPCIIKPAHKDDWWHPDFARLVGEYRKAIVCPDEKSLEDMYSRISKINPGVVLQEYVEGDDLDLYSVNLYLAADGDLLAYFIGHKLRIYPVHAGVGSMVEIVDDDAIVLAAVDAVRKLGLRGHVNIQFKRDRKTGTLKVMEMHARNSLWTYLATAGGLNIPAIAYNDMTGRPCQSSRRPGTDVKWIDFNKDLKAFFDYRRKGEWTLTRWMRSYRGRKVFHVHSLSDPMPFVMDSYFLARRFFNRTNRRGSAPQA